MSLNLIRIFLKIGGGCADDLFCDLIVIGGFNYLELSFAIVTVVEFFGTPVGMSVYPQEGQVFIVAFGAVKFIHFLFTLKTIS